MISLSEYVEFRKFPPSDPGSMLFMRVSRHPSMRSQGPCRDSETRLYWAQVGLGLVSQEARRPETLVVV